MSSALKWKLFAGDQKDDIDITSLIANPNVSEIRIAVLLSNNQYFIWDFTPADFVAEDRASIQGGYYSVEQAYVAILYSNTRFHVAKANYCGNDYSTRLYVAYR